MGRRSTALLGLLAIGTACHTTGLTDITGSLQFSAPSDPTALSEPDAGLVLIDFGQVTVGGNKTLTVDLSGLGSGVTLGSTAAVEPDPEFTLPFVSGTIVGTTPVAVTMTFSPASVGTKSAIFDLTDYSPGAAVVEIKVTGVGVPAGLTVVPNPVDFGRVELNQLQTVSLTITNQSTLPASLTVSPLQGNDAGVFKLGAPADTALVPGISTTMTATFGPLTLGTSTASFTIDGWSTTDPLTVQLTGIGVESWLEVTPSLDFNYVQLNHTFVKPAILTNLSSYATLHLVTPAPSVSGDEFGLPSSSQPTLPAAIAPGQSLAVPVAFAPTAFGPATGSLALTTDDPFGQHPVVDLAGYGGGPSIYCVPHLGFGPTIVGGALTLPVLCENAGSDVPDHPEISLQILPSGVTIDNPVFTPALTLSDGGSVEEDGGVSLSAGQSVSIDVTFAPADAGVFSGQLTVASNDVNDTDAGTTLTGIGALPGACTLQLVPSQLSFGEVPKGDVGKMQFELTNIGQDYCLITDVALAPGSDPAFSLPMGLSGPAKLSFVGGNADGLPTSLVLDVQFAPTISKAVSVGTVDVTSPGPTTLSIGLAGSSAAGCLSIQPPSFDFGLVGVSPSNGAICNPASAPFTATNACAQPLTISRIALAPGPYATPQFTVGISAQLPAILAGGDQLSFTAGFVPTSLGSKIGGIDVTSSDLPQTPYLVTLEGDAVVHSVTDTFTVRAPPNKLDLLWIVDDDDDAEFNSELAQVFPKLIDALDQSQIDYQIAVTSTDACDGGGSDRGSFEPCDHCLASGSSGPTYVTPTTQPDAATELSDLFGPFLVSGTATTGNSACFLGYQGDQFFQTIADAFSPFLLGGHNSGFIRDDAYLAIMLVDWDGIVEDDSSPVPVAEATSIVESLKPDPSQVAVSFVRNDFIRNDGVPFKVGELVQATGGIVFSAGQPDWESGLVGLFAYGGQPSALFTLQSTPTEPASIQVEINGVPTTAWVLDDNNIILTASPPPAPGSTVTVTYEVGCP